MKANYVTYLHPLIKNRLDELKDIVKGLRKSNPNAYKNHKTTKFLAKVIDAIRNEVPKDPSLPKYRLGGTIKPYKHWRRVKAGLPNRYRLFFRYTQEPSVIIYVWLNDENTLRKAGSRTDVYEVFKGMLNKGTVPNDFEALKASVSNLEYKK